ncbi:MAG: GntP family transporter [Proteobacteria bacterium]|uniref:GntP family transporter n=1 Tax=Candidatus Avisuccinivibrio stercorigallinarum TaxID=2840704 RepID=A0A9D9D975_9GAMM|nr:GntP family transporter [Candidatus Avisuccinivibrio stercorigallinarum]
MSTTALLCIAAVSIMLLLFLVIKVKLSAFVALLLVSMITAIIAGIPIDKVMPTLIAGMGSTLGSITIIVGLGAILGRMIEVSGGAEALANYFSKLLGISRTVAAVTIAGFILGIPIFVDVGFIIVAPIVLGFAKVSKSNPISYGLPVAVAMLAVHVVVPPHPGPVAAANILNADVGMLTLIGLILCVPTAIVGFFTARFVVKRHLAKVGSHPSEDSKVLMDELPDEPAPITPDGMAAPNVWLVMSLVIIPIGLIMLGTVCNTILPKDSSFLGVSQFLGAPGTALMVALAIAFYALGIRRNWSLGKIGNVMDSALPTAAVVILVTGGGGVFGKVLSESGVGTALADTLNSLGLPIMLAGFVIAAALRAAQGSATVAILTAAGLLADAAAGYSDTYRVMINIAIGFGALGFSHINDSFFWILTRYLGISVGDGIKTWTVITSVTGIAGFIFTWIASMFIA